MLLWRGVSALEAQRARQQPALRVQYGSFSAFSGLRLRHERVNTAQICTSTVHDRALFYLRYVSMLYSD